ncbi:interferon regulatory factor 3 isoform X2 [Amia ocellicauda]|uniref:interferon regulatory factor 3 isoform X2 n=1 Tax=Amia ocellicauda TaxID=2972642 RepID=UPI003464798B
MGSHKPLLLPWLREQLDSGQFPGVYWTNREQEEFCIPWKHGLRHDSSPHDTLIFKAWAEVSGLFRKGVTQPDPSVWKRNFRCALKSKGVIPLADHSNDSANPHRLFRLPSEREKDSQKKVESSSSSLSQEASQQSPTDSQDPLLSTCTLPVVPTMYLLDADQAYLDVSEGFSPALDQNTLEECLEDLNIGGVHRLQVVQPVNHSYDLLVSREENRYAVRGMSAEEQQLEDYKQGMSSAVINDTLSTQFRVSIYFRGTKIKECLASDPRGFLLVWEGPVGLGAVVGEEGAAAVMDPSVLPLVTLPGSDSLLDRTQAKLTHRLLKKLGAGLEVRVKGQGVWATRRGDTWAYWSLSQHDRSCRPREVPKEGQKVYSMGEFTKGMIDFMEKETGSPATSLWFCLGEKWPDPENRPWEKKLIMVEVTLTSLEILHQLAVQQGASSLHSEEVELQVSDNPSLLNYLLQSLDSMDTS